ncbi:E3 ubiquitin-protein ligase TRIM32-like [Frankliniella occidentalis]|uniref:E3 ubiquitin-protein ligase TRIM32-like n=1 Tax=Frankliniella occidentalis TaxID=133901 RepID=A0A9C6XVJ2_FRAOC|nr:E3 ubiquitin-protein ligase TRIM32-like [Frankliniella occidentalis]
MECDICCKDFDKAERAPKNVPCGHTVCLHCLQRTDKRECPTCRQVFGPPPADLPTNLTILRRIERQGEARSARGWCSDCRVVAMRACWDEHEVLAPKAALRRLLPEGALKQAAEQIVGLRRQCREEEVLLTLLTVESWHLSLRAENGVQELSGTMRNTDSPLMKTMWLLMATMARGSEAPGESSRSSAWITPSKAGTAAKAGEGSGSDRSPPSQGPR